MALSSQHLRTTTWALSRGRRRARGVLRGAAVAAASVAAVLAVGSVPATAFAATTVSATANLINNGCLAAPSVTSGFAVFGQQGQRRSLAGLLVGTASMTFLAITGSPPPAAVILSTSPGRRRALSLRRSIRLPAYMCCAGKCPGTRISAPQ